MPVETPSQRDPAAAHEERGAVILAGSVSISIFYENLGATNRRIQNALENVTFAIPDTTGMVKENRFEINF